VAQPQKSPLICGFAVEAMGLEPTNLLTASQALYQLSYAPVGDEIIPSALVREVRDHVRPGVPWCQPGRLQPLLQPKTSGPVAEDDVSHVVRSSLVHLAAHGER
jgi:hypothetical protein